VREADVLDSETAVGFRAQMKRAQRNLELEAEGTGQSVEDDPDRTVVFVQMKLDRDADEPVIARQLLQPRAHAV
jgi:hypothetical protein